MRRELEERYYPGLLQRDAVARFREALERHVSPGMAVLDLGAGAGQLNAYALKGRVGCMAGVDLDLRVGENPLLDHGVVGNLVGLPFADGTFDLAFSIYVLEHVEHPVRFVAEVARVLKPGGLFLALTPSRFHYVSLIAALTPMGIHRWVKRRLGLADEDVFPTFYRMNTRRDLRRQFVGGGGFQEVVVEAFEVLPFYLRFSTPTFLMGVAYERLVNRVEGLFDLRVNLLAAFRKRGDGPARPRPRG